MSVRRAPDPSYPQRPWLVEIYRDGRRTRRRARTRREAMQIESDLLGAPRLDSRGPENALLEYLTTYVPRLKKPTDPISHARSIRPYLAGRSWQDYPEIERELRRAHTDAGLSTATLNRRLALLRRIARLAEQWGWIERAPRVRLDPESGRETWLTPDQVEALAAAMPRCGDLVRLAAYTGLRKRELLSLTPQSVTDGGVVVETLKQRQRQQRWVPVPEKLHPILERLPFTATDAILRKEWDKARRKCGLQHVRFHDLRHAYASWLAATGVSDRELMALLGHTDPRMISRYAHLRSDHLKRVVQHL